MASCTHCNITLPDQAKFCPRCGRSVESKVAGPGTAAAIAALLLFCLILIVAVCRVDRRPAGPSPLSNPMPSQQRPSASFWLPR